MLKKFFAGLMAAALLFTTSCEHQDLTPNVGGEVTVSVNVSTPEISTRADAYDYSDGTHATELQYAVYHMNGKQYGTISHKKTDAEIHGSTTLSLQLTAGETYQIILWAAAEDAPYTVDFDAKKMTVNYTDAVSNDETRDAFYAVKEFTVNGTQTVDVELKRPFAQLNIGTNDYDEAMTASNYQPTQSSVKVKGIYKTLNLANGAVSEAVDVTFDSANIDKTETFPVAGYDYVAMNYVLVEGKCLVDVEFTVAEGAEDNIVNPKTRTVSSVPVQRNYRTNIYGSLLTSDVDVNVEIKPGYDGTTNVSVWDGVTLLEPKFENNIYEIYEAAELAYIAQLVNGTLDTDNVSTRAAVDANSLKGCTIKLMNDIDLAGEEWTPIGNGSHHFQGTLDGNEHIIHGLKVAERRDARAALIGTVSGTVAFRNLTIKGASIDCPDFDGDFYGSALIGTAYGNVTIENVDVIDSYISGNNKVGALLAHDGVVSSLNITDCDVYNTTFVALNEEDGGSVGALVGYFQGVAKGTQAAPYGEHVIYNSTVKNCIFNVVNSTNTGKRANGQLMGGLDSKAGQELYITSCTIENNIWNETFYEGGRQVTENTFVSPYGAWIGGERDDDAKGRVIIDGSDLVLTQAMLDKALTENALVYLANGEYTINGNFPAGATIIGVGENVTLNIQDKIYTVNGTAIIENVKVLFSNNGYKGFQGGVDLNFKECTIEGQPFLYGTKATFEGCTFVQNDAEQYNVWTYAVREANFIDCVFNCAGKSILVYSEAGDLVQNVNFEGCTFNASAPYNGKAAIEIGASQLTTGMYNVNINDTKVNNFADGSVSGNPVWNVKNGNRANVVVDGEICIVGGADKVSDGLWKSGSTYSVTNAEGLASINSKLSDKSAGRDVAIEILADIDFNGKIWTPVMSHIDWNLTVNSINGNGHTIKNLTINGQAMFTIFANAHDVVVKDITFDNAQVTCNGINSAIIVGQTYNNLLLDNVDVKNSAITGNYKVAALIGTVYNEASTTVTATLKNCDVTNTTVKSTQYDFCTTGMVSFVNASDNDTIQFDNCTISDVKLYGPTTYGYKAHAAIYTTGSEELYNEAEGVTVTNVTFENI